MSNSVPIAVYYRNPNQAQAQTQANDVRWKNQPQMNALSAAGLIFISGGMGMAQGLGWNQTSYIQTTVHFQFCWFVGVIAGAALAAPLVKMLPKRYYYMFSGLLVLVNGIIFTSAPYNYAAIVAARYLDGLAVGFASIAFLVHASELATRSYRGACLGIEQYSLALGVAVQVVYASQWTYRIDFASNRLHGILDLCLGLGALSSAYWVLESPIYHLRQSNDDAALECLRQRQQPQVVTNATKAQLEELKQYVLEGESHTSIESIRRGLAPLAKLVLYRGLVALTFALPLSAAIQWASYVSMLRVVNWVPIIYGVLRWLGAFLALWLLDGLGRKLVPLLGLVFSAGMLVGIAVIFADFANFFDTRQMSVVCTLSLLYQFFAGLFVPSGSAYLGEAFPLVAKPYLLAVAVIVENAVHIIVICCYEFSSENTYAFAVASAVISFVLGACFFVAMPETRSTPLREAQDRISRLLNLKLY